MGKKTTSYLAVVLLLSLTLLSGCSTDTRPAWDLEIRGDLNESSTGYVFSGTVIRDGSINVDKDTHTVNGVKIELLDDSRNLIETVQIGTMAVYDRRSVNLTFSEKPHYVLLKYESVTSAPDAGSVTGLEWGTRQGNKTYLYYDDYDPQYETPDTG